MKLSWSIEPVTESTVAAARDWLLRHEETSMFLLGNLESLGFRATEAPNSGDFKLLRARDGALAGVFCLTRRGTLLFQAGASPAPGVVSAIVDDAQSEANARGWRVAGTTGAWEPASAAWQLLKERGLVRADKFVSKEILYTLETAGFAAGDGEEGALLAKGDYARWKPLRLDYLIEEGLPNDLSDEQLRAMFESSVEGGVAWGLWREGRLVSIANLNARAMDLGQVGGVYTTPESRRRGLSRRLMRRLILDSRERHGIRKMILFTGERNLAAQGLYESLGFRRVGHYGLLFGE